MPARTSLFISLPQPSFPLAGPELSPRWTRQVAQDQEGLQTMANLGRNMAWLLQCIQAGKSLGLTPPQAETACRTDFNR